MLTDVYTPRVSGVTNHIRLTKRGLEARGHEVSVFTFGNLDHRDDEPRVYRSPGMPIADTGYHFGLRYHREAQDKLRTMDVAHVHHPFLSGQLALRYARPAGIPIVFTNHTRYDLYAESYLPMIPRPISAALLRGYLSGFCERADSVIAPSKSLRLALREGGIASPIEVICNGVDLRQFQGPHDRSAAEALGLSPQDRVLIYIGRLAPEKNLMFLLRAFARTAEVFREARLVIAGDGPETERLRHFTRARGLERKVIFTGMIPQEEIPRYLSIANGFTTASVTEVLPLSVLEALASGVPVIGIDSPGVGDVVIDGENGLLSAHDLSAFRANLDRFLRDEPLRTRLAHASRPSAQKYDIQRVVRQLEDHYQTLMRQTRGVAEQRRERR
jgi:1,2-diacylglycerol 3-alpha-glucosyltransferase